MIGQAISHYRILGKLGEGGMGVVYKALDTTLDRVVALKFVSASATSDASTKERLEREARACAALNHPNIMTVYEFGATDERNYIAMEFLEGRTLQDSLKEKKFELPEILDISLQVLDGLDAAHAKGIVHRDLKSANIVLDSHGRAKIMDFGLAKLAQASMLTQAGSTVGTIAYMSPEQARGEEADHRSDIYSLGVVLYQLLTGQLPFPYPHQVAIMYAVVNEEPKPLRDLKPEIPPELELIVLKAMAKETAKRFQSCAEMARSLLELGVDVGAGSSLRKRFRHLFEGAVAVPSEASSVKGAPWFSRSAILKYGIPALAIVLAVAYAVVKMLPFHQNNEWEARKLAKVHVDRAVALMKDNKAELASRELESAIEKDSTYAVAWTNLATLNVRAKRFDVAGEQARKAVALDRKNSGVLYNSAYILEEVGKDEEALVWYKQAIENDPSFTEAYSALGNLYIKMNRPTDAVEVLLKCEQLNPPSESSFLLYKNLGKAYIALQRYDKAREHLERSLELRPDWPETLFLLASVYEALSMTKESIARWQQYASIEKDPAKQAEAFRRLEQLKNKSD